MPLSVRAQQTVRRVAMLMATRNRSARPRPVEAFLQGFEKFGWIDGRNVRIDVRWAGGSAERMREIVTEFVALKPDVIVAGGSPAVIALKRATSTIPVVFVGVNEPVVQGFVASLARPGGNITGFTQVDFSIVGKSVEMLKAYSSCAYAGRSDVQSGDIWLLRRLSGRFQAEARWSMELTRVAVRVPADIDVAVADFAAQPGGGLVVMTDAFNHQSGDDPSGAGTISAAAHCSLAAVRCRRRVDVLRARP